VNIKDNNQAVHLTGNQAALLKGTAALLLAYVEWRVFQTGPHFAKLEESLGRMRKYLGLT